MQTVRRVALNTVIQYVQLLVNVVVGLLTVRIVLAALGETDYGVYNAVAGVVSLLSFVSNSLSPTSIRFLSVSLGKNDALHTRSVFRQCFWLHLRMAVVLSVLLLGAGLFLFDGFLNIPEESIGQARAVYLCMVFSLFLGIVKTPFSALLVAHERFVFISIVGIADALFKLLVAIVVSIVMSDKLAVYGLLMAGVSGLDFICFLLYAYICFGNTVSLHRVTFRSMREVAGFAGWTLLDVMGTVFNREGYALLLNRNFGPVTNSVYALASQIEGHMYTVSASVINAMKPQIMRSQGAGDKERMFRLSMTAGKFGYSLMALITIPLIVMLPELLDLWLEKVPEGTVLFARLMVVACMMEQLTRGLVYANQAEGNIKWFSIIVSGLRMMALPLSWVAFRFFHAPAYAAVVVFVCCESIGSFSRVIVLSRISDFKASSFPRDVLFRLILPTSASISIAVLLYGFVWGVWGMLAVLAASACTYLMVLYFFGLTAMEKHSVNELAVAFFRRLFKSAQ